MGGVIGFLFDVYELKTDPVLTGMLLLACELLLQGTLPVELHAPALLLCQ